MSRRKPEQPTNPLFIGNLSDACDTCGTRVVDGRGVEHPCPFGPHEEGAA
jgi:hypothetical protein